MSKSMNTKNLDKMQRMQPSGMQAAYKLDCSCDVLEVAVVALLKALSVWWDDDDVGESNAKKSRRLSRVYWKDQPLMPLVFQQRHEYLMELNP